MKVNSVEYVGSFGAPGKLPRDRRPEVAIFGRSNVGKSSLINSLLGRRGIARISKTPGKTRMANFFIVNERFYLVDMPGYGYAKVGKDEKARFEKLAAQYFADDDRDNALMQLIDIRHDPTDADIASVARMRETGRPMCVVFNKSDKLKGDAAKRRIAKSLSMLSLRDDTAVVAYSSVSGAGKSELWNWVEDTLSL